jgi:hypothetical protein
MSTVASVTALMHSTGPVTGPFAGWLGMAPGWHTGTVDSEDRTARR